MSDVPCNGCTRCCHHDMIRLFDWEDVTQYQTVPHPLVPGALMLDHKPNDDCIYLTKTGCGIHTTRPQLCRDMDCRNLATNINYTQARKLAKKGQLPFAVWRKGKDLLRTKGL